MTSTTILYKIVLLFVGFLKQIHKLGTYSLRKPIKTILIKKFTKIGIDVILDFSKDSDDKKGNGGSGSSPKNFQPPPPPPSKKRIKNGKVTLYVFDETFFLRLVQGRSMALGEMYMEGLWECEQLDEFITKVMAADMFNYGLTRLEKLIHYLEFELFNLQTTARAKQVANDHYDLSNDLFKSFLDDSMTYTCGYWPKAGNLAEAQQHKLDLIARKLKLRPGMRVLELGCGWGGLAHYLASKYGVSVVACNIAKDGVQVGQERCKGLPVEFRCCDYREVKEVKKFDRVVAVGLMEHIGFANYSTFFQVAHDNLVDEGGLFLIHTIGTDDHKVMRSDPWYGAYIFPNGSVPRATEMTQQVDGLFTLEDWHNFGCDYDKTLLAWYDNFVKNWSTVEHLFGQPSSIIRFYRMWSYYLLLSAGCFRSRKFQLWQIVLSKNGLAGGYQSVR